MKNVLLIGLGRQGKNILNFLINKGFKVYGVCKTNSTKENIHCLYNIDVYLDYKEVLSTKKIDLVILTVFPIEEQYKILIYILKEYRVKVLVDLPISFDLDKLKEALVFDNLYLFNIEHYTKIYSIINEINGNIDKIEATLNINIYNLKKQLNPKNALLVDKFYMLNNFLFLDKNKIKVYYNNVYHNIKDIEYKIKIYLQDGTYIFYKFEDTKGIIYFSSSDSIIIDNIIYTNVLNSVIYDIFDINFCFKNILIKDKYYTYWTNFLISKL